LASEAFWREVEDQMRQAIGSGFTGRPSGSVGGGCISSAARFEGGDGRAYFVKQNTPDLAEMFAVEAAGLAEIAATETIRVPEPVCHGVAAGQAFLVLTWLELGGRGAMSRLGEQLAALHTCGVGARFGWDRDNFIGSTVQKNGRHDDWSSFFLEERLDVQVGLVERRGGRVRGYDRLRDRVAGLLAGHEVKPSLVHGDLWSGNAAFDHDGEPVIFDPAVYHGDGEVDLAMSELFGGFGPAFYASYRAVRPADAGYDVRRKLYNLYHILNHDNLFGGHYGRQAEQMINELLAAT